MADKKVELRVISPQMATDKKPYKFKKDVDMVIIRCTTGDLGILAGRVPCSMVLDAGILRILNNDGESRMAIMGGVAHVYSDVVTVLSDSALHPDEIDVDAVRAEISESERLFSEASDYKERDVHKSNLHRLKVQLEVAGYR